MPFVSENQRKFLWAKHPKMVRKWAHEYPNQKNLPEKLGAVKRKLKSWKPEGYK